MSTDWIKLRVDLRTHPKVVRMASALKADKLRVIGGLFAVWSIFDAHSTDGLLEGYTFRAIDDELGWRGFAAAMGSIDWLLEHPEGLETPRFDEHNGQSAKRRAMETERKRLEREAEKAGTKVGQVSASDADKSVTREEKKEKEKKKPPSGVEGVKPSAWNPPEWVPAKEWTDFVAMRKAMRGVPFTDAAREGVVRELEKLSKLGHRPADLLSTAVTNSWRTVYAPKGQAQLAVVGNAWEGAR